MILHNLLNVVSGSDVTPPELNVLFTFMSVHLFMFI